MNDAVKNADIEDVLSSIRRLVSDDRKMAKPAEPAKSRLVLTEAQRVVPPVSASRGNLAAPTGQTGQAPANAPSVQDAPAKAENVPVKAESVPAQPVTLMEVEALARKLLSQDDETAQERILAEIRAALRRGRSRDADIADQTPGRDPAGGQAAQTDTPDGPGSLAAAVKDAVTQAVSELATSDAALNDTIPEIAVEPETEPARADVLTLGAAERVEATEIPLPSFGGGTADAHEVSESVTIEDSIAFADDGPVEDVAGTRRSALTLEEKIAELEALLGRGSTEFEPDAQDRGGNAAADLRGMGAIPWDAADDDAPARPEPARPAAAAEDPAAPAREPEAIPEAPMVEAVDPVDEAPRAPEPRRHLHLAYDARKENMVDVDELRLLVGRLVREELQGVLGERITRNVRKLVRREVQRALSGQEFD